MSKSFINYTIREIEENDIESGGLLEVLDNLTPVEGLTKPAAKTILKEIKSNPLHRIFVAVSSRGHRPRFDNRYNNTSCRTKIHLRRRASRTYRRCSSEG